MKSTTTLVGLAKARIDHGFSRVGRSLDPKDPVSRVMILLAGRAIALANAVAHLCLNNHPNESLPLLRTLLGLSLAMKALAQGRANAKDVLSNLHKDWDTLFATPLLQKWAKSADYPAQLTDAILSASGDYMRANAVGLPWSHVYPENMHPGLTSDEILRLTAAVMGHVLFALNQRWGEFPGAEEIWKSLDGGAAHESGSK